MFETAIRKSESALSRVVLTLFLRAIAVLGLVWLSIAVANGLALVMTPPLAAAATGAIILAIAALASAISGTLSSAAKANSKLASSASRKTEDVISRATSIAEKMAPDMPMFALGVALAAGIASVSLPAEMDPILNKILDDAEKAPEALQKN